MRSEQVEEARERVIRRMSAAAQVSNELGRQVEGAALVATFAGTDLPAEEMIEQIQRECVGLMLRAVSGVPVQELIMGLALRELLLGFELGRMFERAGA